MTTDANNWRVWHYCHAGEYCRTFDGSCRKVGGCADTLHLA